MQNLEQLCAILTENVKESKSKSMIYKWGQILFNESKLDIVTGWLGGTADTLGNMVTRLQFSWRLARTKYDRIGVSPGASRWPPEWPINFALVSDNL